MEILRQTFWGNPVSDWLLALAIAALVFLLLNLLKSITFRRVRAWVQRTRTDLDDLVVDLFGRTWYVLLVAISIYAGSLVLVAPESEPWFRAILVALLLVQVGMWGSGLIRYLAAQRLRRREEEDPGAAATINALSFFGRVILWVAVVLLALDNVPGVEVTTLIAGLGIAGIAIALAAQTVLRDLFAALAIHLDHPFVPGDFITVGEYWGTVLHTGIKSTRIRSVTGEQVVFSNSNLLDSRIRNFKRMQKRRVAFDIGVKRETPYEKLVAVREIVKDIIESQPCTSYDRVDCENLSGSSLTFEIVYYVLSEDYNLFMETRHMINLELIKRFAEEGIGFA
jgi:small-conductance mechanosensitive channel